MTTEGIHHSKVDVNRLCIKRWNGERGLDELEPAYNAAIIGLSEYIQQGRDRLTRNMTPGKNQILYKKKPIYWSKNFRHKAVLPKIPSINLNPALKTRR
jgi:hypothetical protein